MLRIHVQELLSTKPKQNLKGDGVKLKYIIYPTITEHYTVCQDFMTVWNVGSNLEAVLSEQTLDTGVLCNQVTSNRALLSSQLYTVR